MFTRTYITHELGRRRGRTIVTVLGLALGVGLTAAITSVSAGLDSARETVLNPLAGVGTDLIVTRPVGTSDEAAAGAQPQQDGPGFGPLGPGGSTGLSPEDQAALLEENQSVITDLSKLGEPGSEFEHTYFLPATQLTFPAEQEADIVAIDGVEAVGGNLTLLAVHQTGTVPEIVAEIQTGGDTIEVDQEISPPTAEEEAQIRACMEQRRSGGGQPGSFAQCLPERLRRFRGTVQVPQRTIRQALNPPQTDITSDTYTIAGVDLSPDGIPLITTSQITSGASFSGAGAHEAVVAEGYASRQKLAIGDTLDLNGTTFTIVGLASPPLGGQSADVYVPLTPLQTISGREGRVNVLLVRTADAGDVSAVGEAVESTFDGSQVTSAEEIAATISGSLVDASRLADRLGLVLSVALLAAAFLIASLLSLSSVSKRVRELGTLKAIGWRTGRVVRQVVGESLAQGALGGLVGLALGVGAAVAFAAASPPLQASAASSAPSGSIFGLGSVAQTATDAIRLTAPVNPTVVALALGLAVLGGLIAGAAGALRAARLRPADALRQIG